MTTWIDFRSGEPVVTRTARTPTRILARIWTDEEVGGIHPCRSRDCDPDTTGIYTRSGRRIGDMDDDGQPAELRYSLEPGIRYNVNSLVWIPTPGITCRGWRIAVVGDAHGRMGLVIEDQWTNQIRLSGRHVENVPYEAAVSRPVRVIPYTFEPHRPQE